MKPRAQGLSLLVGAAGVLGLALTLHAGPPVASPDKAKSAAAETPVDERVSVAEARERGKLMHKIYAATLEVMHHRYFRADRAVLPARALEDVFDEIDKQSKIKTRWIAVNTPAMSVNHEPESEFEKKAAEVLASGKTEFDRVEEGYYRRAGAIPLGAGCVGCHTKLFSTPVKTPRFAGLVISIPVKDK
jgi:hypothetical protein